MKNTQKTLIVFIIAIIFILLNNNTTVEASSTYKKVNKNLYYEKGITKKEINKLKNDIKLIPEDIYNDFINNNGKIYLVNEMPSLREYYTFEIDETIENRYDYDKSKNIKTYYILNKKTREGITDFFAHYSYFEMNNLYNSVILENDYYKNNTKELGRYQIYKKYFRDYCLDKNSLDKTICDYLNELFIYSDVINKVSSELDLYNNNYVEINKREEINYIKYNSYIYYDDTVNKKIINSLCASLSILPKNIINRFKEEGFIIVITDEDIYIDGCHKPEYGGFASFNDKLISISTNFYTEEAILFHEIAHVVDYIFSNKTFFAEQTEFYYLYYSNINIYSDPDVVRDYATSNPLEFFACTFKDYILNKNNLKAQHKDIYEYMDNLFLSIL